jgi:hypothetical protein
VTYNFRTPSTYTRRGLHQIGRVARLLLVIAAVLLASATALAAGGHRIELTSGQVDGKQILGGSIAQVSAALGKPDFTSGSRRLRRIGWGRPDSFRLAVLFRPVDGRLRARTLVFEGGSVRDARIGELLARAPKSLQAAVESKYGGEFELVRTYRCRSAGLCTGQFKARDADLRVTFGRTVGRGTFVTVWTP